VQVTAASDFVRNHRSDLCSLTMREDGKECITELERIVAEMEVITPILYSRKDTNGLQASTSYESETNNPVVGGEVWVRRVNSEGVLISPFEEMKQDLAKDNGKDKLGVKKRSGKKTGKKTSNAPSPVQKTSAFRSSSAARRHTVFADGMYVRYEDPADQMTPLRKQEMARFYGTHASISESFFPRRSARHSFPSSSASIDNELCRFGEAESVFTVRDGSSSGTLLEIVRLLFLQRLLAIFRSMRTLSKL